MSDLSQESIMLGRNFVLQDPGLRSSFLSGQGVHPLEGTRHTVPLLVQSLIYAN